MGRCGSAISGARKRLPDMGDACFGSNSAVAGRCADHNLSRIRLIKRAPSLNDRALEAFIRLTQCASKRTLYCASSRSSLCAATHTRRSGTSMWSATRSGSLAEALAALRSAVCRCGPSRDVTTAGLRVLSIQTSRLERPYLGFLYQIRSTIKSGVTEVRHCHSLERQELCRLSGSVASL
jgi:hypothetical protein